MNNLPKIATQWNSGATRESNQGSRIRIPSAVTTQPLSIADCMPCWPAGLEACLWTEMVRTPDRLDYMLFPRLLAVAERAWHEADWQTAPSASLMKSRRTQDWEQFANTLGYRELRTLEHRGINYRLPPPGIRY